MADSLKAGIDDVTFTGPNVTGQTSTVGRVSAQESNQRFTSALSILKDIAGTTEDELSGAIKQIVWLWYHNGSPDQLDAVGGQGTADYRNGLSDEDMLCALGWDFAFRGATRIINRDMLVQQMMQWWAAFKDLLKPVRQLSFATKVYEMMGLKGRGDIVADEDVQQAMEQYDMQMQQGQQQQAMEAQQAAQPQPPPGAPAEAMPQEQGQPQAQPPGMVQ
jgi:hypothetical protein